MEAETPQQYENPNPEPAQEMLNEDPKIQDDSAAEVHFSEDPRQRDDDERRDENTEAVQEPANVMLETIKSQSSEDQQFQTAEAQGDKIAATTADPVAAHEETPSQQYSDDKTLQEIGSDNKDTTSPCLQETAEDVANDNVQEPVVASKTELPLETQIPNNALLQLNTRVNRQFFLESC